ncbi:MAG: sigma-54-dependent Fis family transcriptional regulator [Nitrospiraceae bacterium]|nr:MAG: sigma-54-dependent Fis family transcriptional regulator [Nitrospiraceae bacterium]
MKRILLISKDAESRTRIENAMNDEGHHVETVARGKDAVNRMSEHDYSLVLIEEKLHGQKGLNVLKEIKAAGYTMPVILISEQGSKEVALQAIKHGAYDFFSKPIHDEFVATVINRALEKYALEQELSELKQQAADKVLEDEIVAHSPAMIQTMNLARKVSKTDVTVMITGESGSGKDLFAKTLHMMSTRSGGPFVSVNCAAIPETLLEAELFGYEKGAFTGAARQHQGRFERASGGTIFLDEVGNIPMSLQSKLLRVLQEKVIERLSGMSPIAVDVRVISATNKNLDIEVSQKRFREDLLYRIRVFDIRIPSLRERKEDIPILAERFLAQYGENMGKNIAGFDTMAMKFFMTYLWPGNVREMENLIQRALILEEGNMIKGETVFSLVSEENMTRSPDYINAKEKVSSVAEHEEKKLIMEALIKSHWKRQKAADYLGMSRKSLFNKMKKYGL